MILRYTAILAAGCVALLFGAERFDMRVRNLFFAGFAGDRASLDTAMQICEKVLADNPKHAEARVWYGGGQYYRSGQLFRTGEQEKALALMQEGIRNMDEAVALEPESVGVRVPRGATLLTGSRFMPPPMAKPLIDRGLADYEHVLKLQSERFDKLGEHPKGELLFGLAEGWSRAGDTEKATAYFRRILSDLPGTQYAKRATIWLDTKSLPTSETGCIGCHSGN